MVPILGGRRGPLRSFTNIPRDSDFGLGHLGTAKRFPGNGSRCQGWELLLNAQGSSGENRKSPSWGEKNRSSKSCYFHSSGWPLLLSVVTAMALPVVMHGSWALENWCFWTVVLEKILESPLDNKGVKSVNPNGNQPWISIGRTDAEVPILWPPDGKSWFTGKDPDAGKDWRQEEKGTREDEMVGYHHPLNGPWTCTNSGRQWRTGEPGVLQSMGSQRVRHNLVTEQRPPHRAWRPEAHARWESELRSQDPWRNGRSSLCPLRFFWLVWELTDVGQINRGNPTKFSNTQA